MNIKCANPNCRKIYNSGFNFSNSTDVVMEGNISQCTYCGFPNGLPEGVFNFENGNPKLIKKLSSLPNSSLGELKSLIERTQNQNLGFNEFQKEASLISPEIVDFIPPAARTNASFIFFLTLILTAILQILPVNQKKNSISTGFIGNKEMQKIEKKQRVQRSIERESNSLSDSKWEANMARRKFLEDKRKKGNKD